MSGRFFTWMLLVLMAVLTPFDAVGQQQRSQEEREGPPEITIRDRLEVKIPDLLFQRFRNWTIFGRVVTKDGQPVSAAKVRIKLVGSAERARTVQTDLQG
jgi:hypothetical protein